LKKLGVQILAISPDKPEELKKSIDKNKLNYQLLSDSKIAAAKAFGIAFGVDSETLSKLKGYGIDLNASSGEDHNILPVPSVFAISADGTISNSYVNPDYTQRPSAQFVLTMAKEISQQKKR
jgi:peroxiredoxin